MSRYADADSLRRLVGGSIMRRLLDVNKEEDAREIGGESRVRSMRYKLDRRWLQREINETRSNERYCSCSERDETNRSNVRLQRVLVF